MHAVLRIHRILPEQAGDADRGRGRGADGGVRGDGRGQRFVDAFVIDRLTQRREIADVRTSVVYEHLRNGAPHPLD